MPDEATLRKKANNTVNLLRDLSPNDKGRTLVVVECPKGATVKLKYDADRNIFAWSRGLPAGVAFPADFGFVPRTLAGDGDALDALVLGSSAGFPGVVVPSRLIGVLEVFQTRDGGPEKDNHRLLAVPENEHRFADIGQPIDLGQRRLLELESFFQASLALTGKQIRVAGWKDSHHAADLVRRSHDAFNND